MILHNVRLSWNLSQIVHCWLEKPTECYKNPVQRFSLSGFDNIIITIPRQGLEN